MDILSIIQAPIKQEFNAFKEYYSAQFGSDVPLLNSVLCDVSGSVGKMMRPMLLLLAAKGCGAVTAATNAAAASLLPISLTWILRLTLTIQLNTPM